MPSFVMRSSVMLRMDTHTVESRLTLRSQIADLALVGPWLTALAEEHAIPDDTRYAIDLCLEEAVSNVIRHGYRGEPNHAINLAFVHDGKNGLTLTVEDNAPHFSPAEQTEPRESPASIEEVKPGALGIHLMRRFAGTVRYEQLSDGNRLTLGFPMKAAKAADSAPN
jgi:anti-sigma regulatory factor (Ser/Thr protein kinase)